MSPAPIQLATLDSKPSWVNLAGRVDRSACVAMPASRVRYGEWFRDNPNSPRVGERALRRGAIFVKTWREATATAWIGVSEVEAVMRHAQPRRLSGDFRTAKANAMKSAWDEDGRGLRRDDARHRGRVTAPGPDRNLEANPNAGATRVKLHGLEWDVPVARVHEMLAAARSDGGIGRWDLSPAPSYETDGKHDRRIERLLDNVPLKPASLPGVGLAGVGLAGVGLAGVGLPGVWEQLVAMERWRQHRKLAQHFLICPDCGGKAVKLFLPLCHALELRDARLAQWWLSQRAGGRSGAPGDAFDARLIERYGELFYPRRFRCRLCLGMRYGTGRRHSTK